MAKCVFISPLVAGGAEWNDQMTFVCLFVCFPVTFIYNYIMCPSIICQLYVSLVVCQRISSTQTEWLTSIKSSGVSSLGCFIVLSPESTIKLCL